MHLIALQTLLGAVLSFSLRLMYMMVLLIFLKQSDVFESKPGFTNTMQSQNYYDLLREKIDARHDLVYAEYPLEYKAGTWKFVRIASKEISSDDKVMVIRATIHGDEIAGALTILNYFDDLVNYAHHRHIKLILYPLGNPSGFENGLRYNIDHDKGEGNNDFLRYVMEDGSIESDLGTGKPFLTWKMADDAALHVDLPKEAKMMLELVRQDPVGQVVAALDLHQDYLTEDLPPCAYHYAFGDLHKYQTITEKIAQVVPLLKDFDMNAGFDEQIDDQGKVLRRSSGGGVRSDENGFIIRHDGSFSDFYYRSGAKHSVAPETSGETPLDKACLVNWIWLTGVIDLLGV